MLPFITGPLRLYSALLLPRNMPEQYHDPLTKCLCTFTLMQKEAPQLWSGRHLPSQISSRAALDGAPAQLTVGTLAWEPPLLTALKVSYNLNSIPGLGMLFNLVVVMLQYLLHYCISCPAASHQLSCVENSRSWSHCIKCSTQYVW